MRPNDGTKAVIFIVPNELQPCEGGAFNHKIQLER